MTMPSRTSQPFGRPTPRPTAHDGLRGFIRVADRAAREVFDVGQGTRTLRCDGTAALSLQDGAACGDGIPVNVFRSGGAVFELPGQMGIGGAGGSLGMVTAVSSGFANLCDVTKRRFVDLYGNGWDADGAYLGGGFEHAVKNGNEYQTGLLHFWEGVSKATYMSQPGLPVAPIYDPIDGWIQQDGGWKQIGIVGSGGVTITGPIAGLDDLTASASAVLADGTEFTIQIDALAPDTFQWRKGTGSWTTGVAITGSAQALSDGVSVTIGHSTGHSGAEQWVLRFTTSSGYTGRGGAYYPDTYPVPYGATDTQLHHDDYCVAFNTWAIGMEARNYANTDDPFGLPYRGGYALNIRNAATGALLSRDTRFSVYPEYGTSDAATSLANTQYDQFDVWCDGCGNIWLAELKRLTPTSPTSFNDWSSGGTIWQGIFDRATLTITWGPNVTLQTPDWTGIPVAWSFNRPDLVRTIYIP